MRCCAVFLLPICFLPSTLAAASPRQPNIILVMADDLGWSDIGCYGGEIGTPHIDSMGSDLHVKELANRFEAWQTRVASE
ncbi:MAG: hypothetical protein VB878_25400 [Pirellulaceae bacterium]